MQDKVRMDLKVVVTEDRLPQAITETKTELKNMLTAQPLTNSADYYEQVLSLNAALGQGGKAGQVASRDQLRVRDIIPEPYAARKAAAAKDSNENGGGISRDSTKPGSAFKAKSGAKSQIAQRPTRRLRNDETSRVATPNSTLNARSLEQLSALHEMHSRLTKAKQQH